MTSNSQKIISRPEVSLLFVCADYLVLHYYFVLAYYFVVHNKSHAIFTFLFSHDHHQPENTRIYFLTLYAQDDSIWILHVLSKQKNRK